jgi:hypothetical protein
MKTTAALAALFVMAVAAPASAANVIFDVNGTFGAPGGTLTGTFTTNDTFTKVVAIDLTSSSNGAFQSFEYDVVADVDAQFLPNFFRLTVSLPGPHTDQLQIVFSPALSPAGSAIGGNSFEHQDFQGSGNRILSGTVHEAVAAVPEPTSWALMIAGFGLAGATLRARRRVLATA